VSVPTAFRERQVLMDRERLGRTLARMAHEILERHSNMNGVVLVGVRTRGVPMAQRLAQHLKRAGGVAPQVGALDITLYRDDLTTIATQPILKGTDIPFSIDGRTVVLVDDVLFTGRTVRAALDELIDFGRPARIELAVLVDRGHRELPIRADYVGRTVSTSKDENVQVYLGEEDGDDRVLLMGRQRGGGAGASRKKTAAKPKPKAPTSRPSKGKR
jgi:pyrimidine operon attenuation protein / uracil phosphoribosyltransferase